jgi:hypothetical protein
MFASRKRLREVKSAQSAAADGALNSISFRPAYRLTQRDLPLERFPNH